MSSTTTDPVAGQKKIDADNRQRDGTPPNAGSSSNADNQEPNSNSSNSNLVRRTSTDPSNVPSPTVNQGESRRPEVDRRLSSLLSIHASRKHSVVLRTSTGKVAWDCVIAVLAMYSALEAPLTTAINAEYYVLGYGLTKATTVRTEVWIVMRLASRSCMF